MPQASTHVRVRGGAAQGIDAAARCEIFFSQRLAGPKKPGYYFFLGDVGAIAQLGERLHGMQEVSGSIPLGSTKSGH